MCSSICVFYNFCREVGQQHTNIITLFQCNSRILVENCVVGICNNGMFLQFYELTFEIRGGWTATRKASWVTSV